MKNQFQNIGNPTQSSENNLETLSIREYFDRVSGTGLMKNVRQSQNGYLNIGILTEAEPVFVYFSKSLDIYMKGHGVVGGTEIRKGFFNNLRVAITYNEDGLEVPKLYKEQDSISLDSVL